MSAVVKEFTIVATPERVFNALTQQDEIAHWWTNDLSVKPEVGSLAEFRFQQWGAGTLQFEVARLEAGENVSWISRKGPPYWSGTSVTWQLKPVQDGTNLIFTHGEFAHDGVARANEWYAETRGNWEYFLESLKSYLETGQGTPGAPPYSK